MIYFTFLSYCSNCNGLRVEAERQIIENIMCGSGSLKIQEPGKGCWKKWNLNRDLVWMHPVTGDLLSLKAAYSTLRQLSLRNYMLQSITVYNKCSISVISPIFALYYSRICPRFILRGHTWWFKDSNENPRSVQRLLNISVSFNQSNCAQLYTRLVREPLLLPSSLITIGVQFLLRTRSDCAVIKRLWCFAYPCVVRRVWVLVTLVC